MFKIGDRVKCINNKGNSMGYYLKIGEEYTITKIYEQEDGLRYQVKHDNGLPFGYIRPYRFELTNKKKGNRDRYA